MTLQLSDIMIRHLRDLRPTTHEVGGTIDLDGNGVALRIHAMKGMPCRDEKGRLIGPSACKVHHPVGPCVFHTHPLANRPSSSDLRNTVTAGNIQVLATPQGVWIYKASPELIRRWNRYSSTEKRRHVLEWRFIGHRCQSHTQHDLVEGMLRWLRGAGFFVHYLSYKNAHRHNMWKFPSSKYKRSQWWKRKARKRRSWTGVAI